MDDHLDRTLVDIGREYRSQIADGSRYYLEVDIGDRGNRLGFSGVHEKYGRTKAIVPLRRPVGGMKVRVDGRTFVDYAQFASGVAVPGYVAKDSGLPHRPYAPNDSMICIFA